MPLDAIDDAIALANRPNTPEASELVDDRLALSLG